MSDSQRFPFAARVLTFLAHRATFAQEQAVSERLSGITVADLLQNANSVEAAA